ncbi:hypothetical protein O1L60_37390 [Streptomyces diastatochromogenes]|nr:hypothetical protein [Streptomyces diastatochromogenes]
MPGVSAEEAFAAAFLVPPLPALRSARPRRDGRPPGHGHPSGAGVDPAALEFLAADAATRAYMLLGELSGGEGDAHGGATGPAGARLSHPSVQQSPRTRSGSRRPDPFPGSRRGSPPVREVAGGAGPGRARVAVRGAAASVLDEEWTPDAGALERAGLRLAGAWADDERPALRRAGGARWTVVGADAQLRLGEDGRWWPYLKAGARWSPAGPPDGDPAAALATAFAAGAGTCPADRGRTGPTGAGG